MKHSSVRSIFFAVLSDEYTCLITTFYLVQKLRYRSHCDLDLDRIMPNVEHIRAISINYKYSSSKLIGLLFLELWWCTPPHTHTHRRTCVTATMHLAHNSFQFQHRYLIKTSYRVRKMRFWT